MVTTLITGATGFTGRHLAALLTARGHDIHALVHVNDPHSLAHAKVTHKCDLTDCAAVADVIGAVAPHYVVHLAGVAHVAHADPADMYSANIMGTRNLLAALAAAPSALRRVLIASSSNIYGNAPGEIAENAPMAPVSDYGISKVAVEMVCRLFPTLPWTLIRPFNYTGIGQSEAFLVPKLLRHAIRGSDSIKLGNLAVSRDFSDVRTVVDAYARLLDTVHPPGETFNICSGRTVELSAMIQMVEDLSGRRLRIEIDPTLVRENDIASLCGDPSKIEHRIGLLNHIPLRQTLEWMLADLDKSL